MIPILLDSSTLYPKSLISGYSSLVWNERYTAPDEFKLVTSDVENMRDLLPVDSLISLQDTRRFMIVESHEITKNPEGGYELAISGYGFEGFYKHRVVAMKYAFTEEWKNEDFPEAHVYWLLADNVGYKAQYDYQRVDIYRPGTIRAGFPKISRVFRPGELESVVNDLLAAYNLGIRSQRPVDGEHYSETFTVVIYEGKNRVLGESENPLLLDAEAGDIADESYIDSVADYKNFVYQLQHDNKTDLPVFATYPKTYTPGISTKITFDSTDWNDWSSEKLSQRREVYNRKRRQTLFQGTFRLPPGVTYGQNLFIGDLVTVKGVFGFREKMRLTEYTRIEDAEGERAYPTLSKDKDLPIE